MKKKLSLIIFPIFIGVLIYIFFRSRHLFYYNIFHIIDLDSLIREYRVEIWKYRKSIPNWVIYSLPDGLWIFSFGIALVYQSKFFKINSLLYSLTLTIMILFEFFQKYFGGHGSLYGTYDKYDIYCFTAGYFLAEIFSYFSVKQHISLKEELKNYNWDTFSKLLFSVFFFIILAILPTLFKL